ncbi:hypothetical protein KHC28_23600 [Ancylobacter sonchi]|uniref:hypothetical protein n=1 Tax=Ancylobacter sonchi TaxID=1937790 RepID=UPI001BD3A29B|nr:hypothetical protein [Ancylobacter sonchi]MBS7536647.1 hypothetical protein [Ancylobacter sonchi]
MAEGAGVNARGQKLVEKTGWRGNHRFAIVWLLQCTSCGTGYGANSCDFHIGRCPNCQDGKPGLLLHAPR